MGDTEMLQFKKMNDLKIKHKLFLVYFLIIVINVAMVSIVAYYISFSFIKEQSIGIVSHVQKQKVLEIQNNLKEYESIVQVLLHDRKVQEFAAVNYLDSRDEIDILRTYVDPVIKSILSSRNEGIYLELIRYKENSIEVIGDNFEYILSKYFDDYDRIDANRKFYNLLNINRVNGYEWFSKLYKKMDRFIWMQVAMDKEYDNISLVGEIQDEVIANSQRTGMIRICVSIEKVLAEEDAYEDIEGCVNFIFDESGTLLTGDKEKKEFYREYFKGFESMQLKTEGYKFINNMVFLSDKMKNNWTIITVVPVVSVYKAASNLKYWFLILDVIIIVLLLGMSSIITTSFTKRLNNITMMMQRFKKGDFDVQIHDGSNDELGFLSSVFNNMVKRIKVLIRDNYQFNIDKKDAQLRVLQAQINPHMLYNSLSTISRLAEKQDTQSIKKMVKALCNFYRLSLNKGSDYLSIYEEVEHLKAYIDVFSIRHKNSFRVCYKFEQIIFGYYTVKVVLQPFVENIFEHAMYDLEKPITIVIEGRSEGEDILFEISDDGLGMRNCEVTLLTRKDAKGYGIKNVDERIKLHFGDSYGVRISSIYGGGTTVSIKIPKFKSCNKEL